LRNSCYREERAELRHSARLASDIPELLKDFHHPETIKPGIKPGWV